MLIELFDHTFYALHFFLQILHLVLEELIIYFFLLHGVDHILLDFLESVDFVLHLLTLANAKLAESY